MKSLRFLVLICSFIILVNHSFGQIVPMDEKTNLISYQEVVYEDGGQSLLFNRSIRWLNSYYVNAVAVTRERDAETGVVSGKHEFKLNLHESDVAGTKTQATVLYTFKMEFKEGRYRYTLTDLVLRKKSRFPVENFLNNSDPELKEKYDYYISQIDTFAKEWAESFKAGMKPVEEVKEEEW
ncbi:MAG: DUF4468 domain-containing protein [Bacteroidales bacterium]|nr:DUF4468 domain-containing protein [Bacteroidales bacterium]